MSHATIKSLCLCWDWVRPLWIVFSLLLFTVTMVTLPLFIASHWPLLPHGPIKPIAFNSSIWPTASPTLRSGIRKKRVATTPFKCSCVPHKLVSYWVSEGHTSGRSHCGGLDFTQCTYSSFTISPSLKISSSTQSQRISDMSNSFLRTSFEKGFTQLLKETFWHLFKLCKLLY